MANIDDQKKIFSFIGNAIKFPINCYIIGGGAMLFYNLSKALTKDIDIVLESQKDRKLMIDNLIKKGFMKTFEPELTKSGEPVVLEFGEIRLDIFAGMVFKLEVTKDFWSRAKEKLVFGNLNVFVASLEDVMILKSLTDRPGDRYDAETIIKETNVDWEIVENVIDSQSRKSNFNFIIRIADFVDELKKTGLPIPQKLNSKIQKYYFDVMERVNPGK